MCAKNYHPKPLPGEFDECVEITLILGPKMTHIVTLIWKYDTYKDQKRHIF